ncbi:hypothetical protein N7508_000669 [Penicillium antarcticum]|uniref:uncharacterized protein n=1 Tax=Penicillium antarcticum TaxID=416450 RepID=UPI0023909350|nr:uncharacterized protein N7508_000669 [Penicillium antarcticum]KAJ5320386.1 hypothetical protein N7508_000669 [Penicillium antarcticum]
MPALPSFASGLANSLVHRATLASPPNATGIDPVLEVVCAWPVSGQYGPGTRVLYYALIAACVVARKVEFIRSACLAAVLLFPAVAAIHGIVLAVLHVDGAVDMDVYGAFQLCAIGILTAPATVRLSTTYFNNPGRDLIFLWTVLLLAGLLSLIVEFMRLKSVVCPINEQGGIEWTRTNKFPYGESCGMRCTPEDGPISRLRQGSADNIYVVPTPSQLTFNTTTLLAAGCCVPAILQLVSMWIKIMDANWEKFSRGEKKKKPEEPIEGTNGATLSHMTGITEKIRSWLALIEIPVFAAAVLFILVKGEMNFWSWPVYYQTERIASIGQWAPIVGTGLAVFGSLYLLISAEIAAEGNDDNPNETQNPQMIITTTTCAKCQSCAISSDTESNNESRRNSETATNTNTETQGQVLSQAPSPSPPPSTTTPIRTSTVQTTLTTQTDVGNRRKVARFFNALSTAITTKAAKQTEKSGFNQDERTTYPTTPGENLRNPKLAEDISIYNKYPPSMDGRSRAGSFISVSRDSDNGEGSSRIARSRSPARHSSLPGQMHPPPRAATRPSHSNSEPGGGLFGSSSGSYLGSPGLAISEWQMGLSPVSVTPEGRSRGTSISDGSPSPTSTLMSGAQAVPRIHVSSHGGP